MSSELGLDGPQDIADMTPSVVDDQLSDRLSSTLESIKNELFSEESTSVDGRKLLPILVDNLEYACFFF